MKTRFRFRWTYLVVALGTLFLASSIVRAVLADSPTRPRPSDVRAAERTAHPASGVDERMAVPRGRFVGGNGIVEPAQRETKVAAQVAGRVLSVDVSEGQFVHAGDVLVRLDASVEQAVLDAAAADVEVAQADLARTLHGNRRDDVQASLAAVDAARARAELSAGVLARTQAVAQSGGVTQDELDRARRQAEVDRATADQAAASSRVVLAGSRREDVMAARARLEGAEARRAQAQAQLDERIVRAPIDGEVLQVKYHAGEYYAPGPASDPLVVMGDTRVLRVRVDVDERDVGKVREGATAIVRAAAFPGVDFRGHVVEIAERMGRKNVRTDDPVERNDTKILEVVLAMDTHEGLVVGQRVMSYVRY